MLLFGSNQISKWSEFHLEGATTENARHYIVKMFTQAQQLTTRKGGILYLTAN